MEPISWSRSEASVQYNITLPVLKTRGTGGRRRDLPCASDVGDFVFVLDGGGHDDDRHGRVVLVEGPASASSSVPAATCPEEDGEGDQYP